MLFNSVEFMIFFPVVTALYFMIPHKHRWALLLAASCIFYMAFIPIYILVLATTIVIDYFAGIKIEGSQGKERKLFLLISVLSTGAVLVAFKYFVFINANLQAIAQFLHWNYGFDTLRFILPIGLSFHTFQSLSYVIEVYRGKQKAERHFGIYSLYVMFFPQLVAGPIERPQNLLHQFYEKHDFDYVRVTNGLKLMAWGLFKKVVVADRLALLVDPVYKNPYAHDGFILLLATTFFAFQIYCDFSGYSDIAIGTAQVMGFKLMDNFKRPYYSKSILEFWKRWHISLSTWFKDYVYIPLGGSRVIPSRWVVNLLITFVISGAWHGASWTFIIWGALNGLYVLLSIWTTRMRATLVRITRLARFPSVYKSMQVATTFSLISFSWIFFRAENVSDAIYISSHIFVSFGSLFSDIASFDLAAAQTFIGQQLGTLSSLADGSMTFGWKFSVLALALMELVHLIQRRGSIRNMLGNRPVWFRWPIYYSLALCILLFGVFDQNQFVYFQF